MNNGTCVHVDGRDIRIEGERDLRELIRKDADRQRLRGLLLDGAASSPTTPVDAGYFAAMRERVQQRTRK